MGTAAARRTRHPIDVGLGRRIRVRRRELGLNQDQLARQLGITFQQLQKYERGTNRVSFSRLVEIAQSLKCSLKDIIGDLDTSTASPLFSQYVVQLNVPGVAELLESYCVIGSGKHRRAILNLAKQLSKESGTPP
jgi:transcriptional regulator with XRE-family HTH domain